MNTPIRKFSMALASILALGLIACGSSDTRMLGPNPGPGPDPTPALPGETLAYPPVVGYTPFAPKTEAEFQGLYNEGVNAGRPIANYGYLIAKTRSGFNPAAFAKHGLEVKGSFSANGATYYYLHKDSGLVETMKKVGKMNGMLYIEPDIMLYTTGGIDYNNPDQFVNSQQQYGVLTTHTKKAWETYGFGPNKPVVVGIDTGVNYNHPDMANVVRHAFSWFDQWGNDVSGNPLNDPEPVDWLEEMPDEYYGTDGSNGHGSHTAGTMAAVGNNGIGVAGMCWNVDLVSYKAINDYGQGSNWTVFGSLWHLAKWKSEKVDGVARYPHTIPVNMSLGAGYVSQFDVDMIEMALEHDIVVCCSSGNDNSGFPSFPGSITGTIRVGAVNLVDRRVDFSNWGNDLSVVAPGERVLSTMYDTYYTNNGTSMACPHVTGLVGYMLTFAPDLKPDQIRTYIEKNADPIDGQKGFDPRYGHGRINTFKTIGAVVADANAGTAPASNYVLTPVKVTVKTTSGLLLNNAIVYLYNCNQSGTITNYAGLAPTGPASAGVRDNPNADPEDGVAWFNMLKPGYYKVAANYSVQDLVTGEYSSDGAESQVFEVKRGATVAPITLALSVTPPLVVQTFESMGTPGSDNGSGWIDSCIAIYDEAHGLLADFDEFGLDTFSFGLATPGTYWIRIYPYEDYFGEYALWFGTELQPAPAPGTYGTATPGPDGNKGSQGSSKGTAQLIKINDKIIYGNMWVNQEGGDWYKFVIE